MFGGWRLAPNEYVVTNSASIQGPYGIEEWPNNISSKWQFYDGEKWQEAKSSDIVFEDVSPKGNFTFS